MSRLGRVGTVSWCWKRQVLALCGCSLLSLFPGYMAEQCCSIYDRLGANLPYKWGCI